MEKLVGQRGKFVADEKKKLAEKGKGDGFDLKVKEIIREQAASKGIKYGSE